MAMSTEASPQFNSEPLYEFSIYPFSTDPVFQEGLRSIVSSAHSKSPEELENVIGQAKAFYFTRTTGRTITWDNYVEWKKFHPSAFPSPPVALPGSEEVAAESRTRAEAQPPLESIPLTFQQITELIQSGQTDLIPNNKVIPEALHSDAPSDSTRPVRKKPWEAKETQTETAKETSSRQDQDST